MPDTEAKHDADTEAELLSERLSLLFTNMISSRACRPRKSRPFTPAATDFIILELRDYEPLFDGKARSRTVGFEMPLTIVVGAVTAMTAWLSPFQ